MRWQLRSGSRRPAPAAWMACAPLFIFSSLSISRGACITRQSGVALRGCSLRFAPSLIRGLPMCQRAPIIVQKRKRAPLFGPRTMHTRIFVKFTETGRDEKTIISVLNRRNNSEVTTCFWSIFDKLAPTSESGSHSHIFPRDPFVDRKPCSCARGISFQLVPGPRKVSPFRLFVRRFFCAHVTEIGRKLSSMKSSSMWRTLCSTIIKVREIVASSLTRSLCDHIRSLFARRQSCQHVIVFVVCRCIEYSQMGVYT